MTLWPDLAGVTTAAVLHDLLSVGGGQVVGLGGVVSPLPSMGTVGSFVQLCPQPLRSYPRYPQLVDEALRVS